MVCEWEKWGPRLSHGQGSGETPVPSSGSWRAPLSHHTDPGKTVHGTPNVEQASMSGGENRHQKTLRAQKSQIPGKRVQQPSQPGRLTASLFSSCTAAFAVAAHLGKGKKRKTGDNTTETKAR